MTPQRPRPPAPRPAPPRRGRGAPAGRGSGAGSGAGSGSDAGAGATEDARTAPTRAAAPDRATPPASGPRTAEQPAATPRRTSGTALAPRTGAFPVRPAVVSAGSAARFAERARARRRLAWRQILIASGSVVAVGALAWLLLLSPVLALDVAQVRVTGAGTVVAVDQVRAVVDAEGGTPLTRLDTTRLRTALLDVPGVRDVTVRRDWPHGLLVQLVSREPVAAVPEQAGTAQPEQPEQPGGADPGAEEPDAEQPDTEQPDTEEPAGPGYALVDQDGVQVGRTDAAPEGLPVVEVPVGEGRILAAALGVLESVPEALRADIAQVSAGTQDTVQFVLRDGAVVEWGSAQEPDLKSAVLQALRVAPETAGSARYDVSAPTMPVVG